MKAGECGLLDSGPNYEYNSVALVEISKIFVMQGEVFVCMTPFDRIQLTCGLFYPSADHPCHPYRSEYILLFVTCHRGGGKIIGST